MFGDRLEFTDFTRDSDLVPPARSDVPPLRFFYGLAIPTGSEEEPWFVAVLDRAPRRLTAEQRSGLQTIAQQVLLRHELSRSATSLARTTEEQRRIEAALRESEVFYETLVESLPQNIFRKDLTGRFTFVNSRFCAIMGRSREEIIGRSDADFFPPELAAKYRADDQQVIDSGQPVELTEINISGDGSKHYVHVIKTPLFDTAGRPAGIQGIFWDVTAEKRAEEALAHERDLLRALLDNAPDAIYFKDAQSRILRASRALAQKFGFNDASALVGKSDADFFSAEHARQALADEQAVMAGGQPILGLTEKETWPDGRATWVLTSKLPLRDAGGRIVGTFGISKDITELKQAQENLERAEANYRSIVENALDGIFQTTPDGHYLSANRALARIYGFNSPDELKAMRTDIEHQLYVDPNRRHEFARLMQEQGQVDQFESQVYRADGSVIWISENARAVRDAQGTLLYYEGTVEDITGKKRAEEALNRANAALAAARDVALESARSKAQFLANTSHEIRTPMNAIVGFTQLLLDTPLTPEQREYAETVRSSSRALLTLLNDILDFSKIESGKVTFEQLDFDPRDTIEDTAELMAELAYSKGLEFSAWLDHGLPRLVRGDPGRLRQVLTNLLGNAIKFTSRGEVGLRVTLVGFHEGRAAMRFEVRDTGIGIAPQAQSKIFEVFTQADGSTTRRFGGSGLGLSISKQLVERMGGGVGFQSREGLGSTFWFTVALEVVPEPNGAPVEEPKIPPGLRILIVDDHLPTQEALRHELEPFKCDCAFATMGEQALEMLREASASGRPFDMALVDLQLPDLDGHTVAGVIAKEPPLAGLKVALMAPLGQRLEPELLRGVGVRGYLVKPVKQARLRDCLELMASGGDGLEAAFQTRRFHRGGATSERPPLRILLAEDNLVNQKVALAQLKRLGYTADVVSNGRRALDALADGAYQIVLMDCQMPELDGYETTHHLRRGEADGLFDHRPPHYIVALTANAMAGDREKCLAAGMDDFLTKPIEVDALSAALHRGAQAWGLTAPGETARTAAASLHRPGISPGAETQGHVEPALDSGLLDGLRAAPAAGGPDEAAELANLFLSDLPRRMEALHTAVSHRDVETARNAAHALKGSASNIGGRRLAATCGELESAAKSADWTKADATLTIANADAEALRAALVAWLAG
jgi:PAS domain S-box-containing protein